MKHLLSFLIFTLLLLSCVNNNETDVELVDVTFSSEINSTKTNWKLGEVYHDTLEFLSFDDNYDYWYGVFKTKEGNIVSLVYDDVISSQLEHGILAISWKIDSLYEAGEGDEMYYEERLMSFSVIEKPEYFGDYLTGFIKAYSNDTNSLMVNYTSEKVGFYTTFNPGLYCIVKQQDIPSTKHFIDIDCEILEECLLGNYCDGYPNIEDGFYFESVIYDDVPVYESQIDEHLKLQFFPINEDYIVNDFKKVTIVVDEEQHGQLYFIRLDNHWYLWVEDKCDCSA